MLNSFTELKGWSLAPCTWVGSIVLTAFLGSIDINRTGQLICMEHSLDRHYSLTHSWDPPSRYSIKNLEQHKNKYIKSRRMHGHFLIS